MDAYIDQYLALCEEHQVDPVLNDRGEVDPFSDHARELLRLGIKYSDTEGSVTQR